MAVAYGTTSTLITNDLVHAVYTNNMNNVSYGNVGRGFQFYGTNTQGGCGNPNGDSGCLIIIKDTIHWNRISCLIEFDGSASCWSILGGGTGTNSAQDQDYNFGFSGPNVPFEMTRNSPYYIDQPGNILPYNESLGDKYFWDVNTFSSNSNFIRKASACDNEPTNMFHGAFHTTSGAKSFWTKRRRHENGNLAGVFFGRSCASIGKYSKITNIRVWYEAQ